MKRKIVYITLAALILALVMSACGGSTEQANSDGIENVSSTLENQVNSDVSENGPSISESIGDDSTSGSGIGEGFQDAMPVSAQLGFGTLLLEDSTYAVDPTQAAALLPLWKAARSLSESETAAQEELDAIFSQIEDTMTPEQINTIAAMQLTGEEMAQLMEDLGIEFGPGRGGFGDLTPEQQETAQAARESGEGLPGGGIPGSGQGRGGGEGFGGGNLTPEQQATMEARRAERSGVGARFALVFVEPLIELLEERASE
jgi:hypothetical protein